MKKERFTASRHHVAWQGVFNKEAMIRKLLVEYSAEEATWVWWVDIDTVIANQALPLPLPHYEGYEMVAWGRREHLLEGRMNDGAPHTH